MSEKSSTFAAAKVLRNANNYLKDMKKYLFISLLAIVVGAMFTACEVNDPTVKKTIDLKVKGNQWDIDSVDHKCFYFCHFDVPELTKDVYNYGEISVNREYNSGTEYAYQVALPETTYCVDTIAGNPYYYTQHVDYAYGIGFVEVFVTISDYYYDEYVPETMLFRLQMTY